MLPLFVPPRCVSPQRRWVKILAILLAVTALTATMTLAADRASSHYQIFFEAFTLGGGESATTTPSYNMTGSSCGEAFVGVSTNDNYQLTSGMPLIMPTNADNAVEGWIVYE